MPSPGNKLRNLFHRQKNDSDEPQRVPQSPTRSPQPAQPSRLSTSQNGPLNGVPYESTPQGSAPRRGERPLTGDGPTSPETSRIRKASEDVARSRSRPAGPRDKPDPRLPEIPHQQDLSAEIQHSALAELDSPARKSSDVVGRAPNGASSKPISLRQGRCSEDVADWNVMQANRPQSPSDVPPPLNVAKAADATDTRNAPASTHSRNGNTPPSPLVDSTRRSSVSRRAVGAPPSNPRSSMDSDGTRGSTSLPVRSKRTSVDKPLPIAPRQQPPPRTSNEHQPRASLEQRQRASIERQPRAPLEQQPRSSLERPTRTSLEQRPQASLERAADMAESKALPNEKLLVKDSARPPSLKGVVDLSRSEDTTVHEKWAPAVVKETVNRDVHHVREEQITREIHTHDVYHRILPIIDIEVLPARHFVPIEGGNYAEISADEVPGRIGENQGWIIAETLSKLPTQAAPPTGPRQFTARTFENDEGDYKEYTNTEGILTTETTWVHPPTVEEGGMLTGQTVPFHFGSEDPADDGLRAKLPVGKVIGSSPLLNQQKRAAMPSLNHKGSSGDLRSETANAPAVSTHNGHAKLPSRSRNDPYNLQEELLPTPPHTANRASFASVDGIGRAY